MARSVTLHHGNCLDVLRTLPSESVDSVVTDPPYGLSNTDPKHVIEALTRWAAGERDFVPEGRGFMGKSWDSFVPPPAVWDECLRVLKPGGHLLAFAGSRTFDLMTLSIRFAGFDIRDSIAWLYGSGFPKSLDVSKAIDKRAEENGETKRRIALVAEVIRSHREAKGMERAAVSLAVVGTPSGACWNWEHQQLPSVEMWPAIKRVLGIPDEFDGLIKGDRAQFIAAQRAVIAERRIGRLAVAPGQGEDRSARDYADTAPATPDAERWHGWGTALKPAFEPIVVARKPLAGTVAANVLAHGTGALNIDGTRIGSTDNSVLGKGLGAGVQDNPEGRWPANVVLDESQAAELDQQSGITTSPKTTGRGASSKASSMSGTLGAQGTVSAPGDSGGASRFFYVAKAPKKERPVIENEDGTKTAHPTVKPLTLMRWLVKLVTPPGGTVLEPFPGSGTTVEAAVLEDFDCIAAEREAEYIPLIEQRLARNGVTPTIIRPAPEAPAMTWEERRVAAYWCPVYVPAPHPRGHQPGCECVGQLPEILPEVEPA